jgi:hypothetical protein
MWKGERGEGERRREDPSSPPMAAKHSGLWEKVWFRALSDGLTEYSTLYFATSNYK